MHVHVFIFLCQIGFSGFALILQVEGGFSEKEVAKGWLLGNRAYYFKLCGALFFVHMEKAKNLLYENYSLQL